MDFTLEHLPAFAVIGKCGQGGFDDIPRWLLPLWEAANRDFAQIERLVKRNERGQPVALWGAMSDRALRFAPWDADGGLYLAGCEALEDAQPPEGWTRWDIPAQTYAVAACTQADNSRVWADMKERVLPRHGYRLAGASHERYQPGAGAGELRLYFPVQPLET